MARIVRPARPGAAGPSHPRPPIARAASTTRPGLRFNRCAATSRRSIGLSSNRHPSRTKRSQPNDPQPTTRSPGRKNRPHSSSTGATSRPPSSIPTGTSR